MGVSGRGGGRARALHCRAREARAGARRTFLDADLARRLLGLRSWRASCRGLGGGGLLGVLRGLELADLQHFVKRGGPSPALSLAVSDEAKVLWLVAR